MRIPLREQLALLLAFTSLLALTVLAVATWIQSDNYITESRSSALALTASLKSAEIAHTLQLYTDSAVSIGTRIFIQEALQSYNSGNASEDLIRDILEDLKGALSGSGKNALLVQSAIYPRSNLTPSGAQEIVGVTGDWVRGRLELPYNHTNGTPVFLGDAIDGFPKELYPNLTYIDGATNVSRVLYEDRILVFNSVLILGPLYLNNSSSLISITVAINNNTSREDILGWLTVVMDARLFYDAVASPEGLGSSGEVLIIGPTTDDNRFKHNVAGKLAAQNANTDVWYVLPPPDTEAQGSRHDLRAFGYPGNPDLPFKMAAYPAVLDAWSKINNKVNNAGAYIRTHNEEGKTVSAGYAQINFASVDWILVFEQSHGEVVEPIVHLRNIILACIFAVVGAIVLVSLPVAHCVVRPIRQLRTATQNSITVFQDDDSTRCGDEEDACAPELLELQEKQTQQGSPRSIFPWSYKRALPLRKGHTLQRHVFHIPQKVPIRRAIVSDELTDLTSTFNEMSDELTLQYNKLEERVKIRTAELEQSRNAAQVANESKTLFVGNISHELRTPLNGILGMCSIALHERDTSRVREALKIIYKSGDLLLHLLNDLLTFSRNSYGERLAIEEENFRLVDVGTQITSIFEKQAREAQIDLKVVYLGSNPMHSDEHEMLNAGEHEHQHSELLGFGPGRTGLVRDMSLRGDKHRILQILMNLVSNSLKFTPAKGVVEVRIKCLGYAGWELPKLNRATTRLSQRRNSMGIAQAKDTPYTLNQNISEELTNLAFQFEVEDTGPGISEHMQEEIFKPFVQGDLALSKKYGGTGLGLAICSQLAALMQGTITLRSTISVGSTFTLSLNLRYVRDRASSLSTVNDHPHSIPSISKPNSMNLSSLRAPSRSPVRSSRRQSPSRGSFSSGREARSRDVPRVVGYSQPYLTDDSKELDDRNTSPHLEAHAAAKLDQPMTPPGRAPVSAINNPHHRLDIGLSRPASPLGRKVINTNDADTSSIPPQANEARCLSPTPSRSTATANNIRNSHLRVLVAEDNRINQEVVVRMLKLEKVTDIKVVADGKEALDIVRDTEPTFSLIFMDIQMPNMDGIESTRHIRSLGFTMPIVALTAFADESNRKACMEAGTDAFLPKPIKRAALKDVLKQFSDD